MSKLLILLLFALSLNYKLIDGIPAYDFVYMKMIMKNVYELNVKEGDEFYIEISTFKDGKCKCSNYNEFKEFLYDFGKNGEKFESRSYNPYPYYSNIIIGSNYFKFKALKPSSNKISLKFPHTSPIEENYCKFNKDFCADYVIKINILPKEEAS